MIESFNLEEFRKSNIDSELEQRIEKLKRLKSIIKNKESEICECLKADLGKSHFESYLSEISYVTEKIDFMIKNLPQWIRAEKVSTPLTLMPAQSYIYPEPYGVVLVIAPWNYPFQLAFTPLIGALAAGNKVVLKPSEISEQTSKMIKEIITTCFDPQEVICILGGVEETQALLKQKFDYIFFTGSTEVGKIVMKAAAEHLTPLTLELGGKSPCIIDESADLKNAAKKIIWGKILNSGQTCVAPDYVYVHESGLEELLEHMKFFLENFLTTTTEKSPDYGRIINEKHFQRLEALLDGHEVYHGGERNPQTRFFSPTIIINPSLDSKIMKEEVFGPILPILTYGSLDKVFSTIKSKPKPLALYIFSEDKIHQDLFLKDLSFGGGCINDTIVHLANPSLPFGGVGESGMGHYNGKKSFETFSHFKSILKQSSNVDFPLRYPPYQNKMKWLKWIK